jgi:hypothetical protein
MLLLLSSSFGNLAIRRLLPIDEDGNNPYYRWIAEGEQSTP